MNHAPTIVRLALRDARNDLRRLSLCALLVGLAVTLGVWSIGSDASGGGSDLRIELDRVPGALLSPQPVRFWDRREVVVRGAGRALRVDQGSLLGHGMGQGPGAAVGRGSTLPRGSELSAFAAAPVTLIGDRRMATATAFDADIREGPVGSATRLVRGRAPVSRSEVALDEGLALVLRAGIGDTVTASGRTLRVVGLLSGPVRLARRSAAALVAPGSLSGRRAGWAEWLVRLPADRDLLPAGVDGSRGSQHARVTFEAPARRSRSTGELIFAGVVQAFALAVPLLVVAAVLAMGVERRVRERTLLELAGAGPGVLRALEALRGVLIGLGGAATGVVLTLGYAAVSQRRFQLTPAAVAVPATVAVLTSALAVSLSAETARQRLRAVQSVPGLPPWWLVRRELARGGILLAGALLAAVGGGVLGGPPALIGALLAAVCGLLALAQLGPALVVLPALLPLPTALRASTLAAARARWVSGPAATAFAVTSVLVVFSVLGAAGAIQGSNGSLPPPVALGDAHLAAIRASTLVDERGRLLAPSSTARAVASTLPGARLVAVQGAWQDGRRSFVGVADDGRLYVASSAALERLGVPAGSLLPGRVLVLGQGQDLDPSLRPLPIGRLQLPQRRAVPDWPMQLPHLFIDAATALQTGVSVAIRPTYLVSSSSPIEGQRASDLRAAAAGAGLGVSTVAAGPTPAHTPRLDAHERLVSAGLELGLALLFGGLATALVLAEMRAEARLLLLAGARPRDHRLRAAAAGFTLGATGVLLAAIGVVILCALATTFGSARSALGAVGPTLMPLLLVPFLLAVGAGVLSRPARTVGRIGRVPRDAATILR